VRRHEISVVIARPVAEVFAYVDDVSREHEWQPQLAEATQSPTGPTATGTRKRYVSHFLGKRVENTYVVTAYEPGVRIATESTPDSALRARSEIRFEEARGGTRVTMSIEGAATGALRFVPARVAEAAFVKEAREALDRLKERLERG